MLVREGPLENSYRYEEKSRYKWAILSRLRIVGYDDTEKLFKFKNSWSAADLIEDTIILVRKTEGILAKYA